LRLNCGIAPTELRQRHGEAVDAYEPVLDDLVGSGLLERTGNRVRLTARGRLLSNEVFVRFLRAEDGRDRTTHLQASS
jgi:oxygen-independent coproporphyrinogen-3 oxidase